MKLKLRMVLTATKAAAGLGVVALTAALSASTLSFSKSWILISREACPQLMLR